MFSVIQTAVLWGISAKPVRAELSTSGGLPGITIVGLPDSSVLEARHRVRNALKEAGYKVPQLHITINLAPAEIRKSGTGLDFAIALAILSASEQIPSAMINDCLFVSELSIDGKLRPVRGMQAYLKLAKAMGKKLVGAPSSIGEHESYIAVSSIGELKAGLRHIQEHQVGKEPQEEEASAYHESFSDFEDVVDQEMAKRACVISAAGKHGLLMVGPPGAGKTMLARRLPSILPPLDEHAREESLLIYSVAGQEFPSISKSFVPFRAPHHSISRAGMIGGGRPVIPGEISLAHKGVLFLDEFPEFATHTLQSLRQPLEDHEVRLVRVDGIYSFPCDFMLVAAANPCPCGHLGDEGYECSCSPARIQSYQNKIGGPLMDRIDLSIQVSRPSSSKIIQGEIGLSSHEMRELVLKARDFASWRISRLSEQENTTSIARFALNSSAEGVLERMATTLLLGGRGIYKLASVARTIADMNERDRVTPDDVIEACAFRTRMGQEMSVA